MTEKCSNIDYGHNKIHFHEMVISQLELYKNIKDVYNAKKKYIYYYLSYKNEEKYNFQTFETIIQGLSGYQISRQEYDKICKLFEGNHKISYKEFDKEIYGNNYPEVTFDDYIKYFNTFNSI